MLISTSYALWTVNIEKNNNLNIVAGVLNYELTSPELNGNKQVVVPANSEKRINITLKSLNAIDSDYSVYYQGSLPNGVTIMYDGASSKPSDNISITGTTKSMTIIIRNNSSSNYTATLGVKGGLTNKVLALDSNTYQITNTYSFSKDYAYTGNYQTFTASVSGYYNLEAWGAQGGGLNNNRFTGGNGAYTKGLIYLNKNETVNIYVGGQGSTNGNGGYNGGGNAGTLVANNFGGGGATDFRLTAGAWNDITSLRSRIMVSAGGGGSGMDTNSPNYVLNGGQGGTLFGQTGTHSGIPGLEDSIANSGTGGTQNSGGKGAGKPGYNTAAPGTFGIGGIGSKSTGYPDTKSGSGGGGGYYGGGGGIGCSGSCGLASSSGSSYISGYAGVNAINSGGGHTNQTMHFSNKYFINGEMQAGTNTGNGKAKITYISSSSPTKVNTKLNNVRYIKDCSNGGSYSDWTVWVEIEAIKNGINVAKDKVVTGTVVSGNSPYQTLVDGILSLNLLAGASGSQCVTVDLGATYDLDELVIWHKWEIDRLFYYATSISTDNINYDTVLLNNGIEKPNGNRISAYSNDSTYFTRNMVTWYDMKHRSLFPNTFNKDKMFDLSGRANTATLFGFDYTNDGWFSDGLKSDGNGDYVRFLNKVKNLNSYTFQVLCSIAPNAGDWYNVLSFDGGYGDNITGAGPDTLRIEKIPNNGITINYPNKFIPNTSINGPQNSYIPNKKVLVTFAVNGTNTYLKLDNKPNIIKIGNNATNPVDYISLFIRRLVPNEIPGGSIAATIYSVRFYDKMLTDNELNQNFRADQYRFGL